MEQWRTISDWPAYEVSDLGRVRRRGRILAQSWSGTIGKQYLVCGLSDAPRQKCARIHCLVAEAFLGGKPKGFDTAHLDGDRSNNALANLAYVTPSENNLHKRQHGTMNCGSRRYNAKLTEQDVRDIRARAESRHPTNSYAAIGRDYGINPRNAQRIATRKAWVHVD